MVEKWLWRKRYDPIRSHTRTIKISPFDESRLRTPPRHGGAGFFSILLTDPPRGHPVPGRRYPSCLGENEMIILNHVE
jgi:hypothetical protein